MPTRILILSALLAGAIAGGPIDAQDIYRWVDKDGVIHFSDTAPRSVSGGVSRVIVEDTRPKDYDPEADIYNVAAQAERMQALREKMEQDREERRGRQRNAVPVQQPEPPVRSVGYGFPPWWWDRPDPGRPPEPELPELPDPEPPPTSTLRPPGQMQD